jgi:hypothetical protein
MRYTISHYRRGAYTVLRADRHGKDRSDEQDTQRHRRAHSALRDQLTRNVLARRNQKAER